jgi:DNA-binding HxlR family transcriptional regulator
MTTTPKRESRLSPFLPLDLRVYVESKDPVVWGVTIAMNRLEWKLGRGEITQDELEAEVNISNNTLRVKLHDMERRGWIEINRKVKPHIYRKTVPEMSWDEANMLQKLRNVEAKDSSKIAESSRKNSGIIPQNLKDPNIHIKDHEDPIRHSATERAAKPQESTTGEDLDQDMRRSGFFALWNSLYVTSKKVGYAVSNKDWKAYRELLKTRRSWASISQAMRDFFAPGSWDMKKTELNITIHYFVGRIDSYVANDPSHSEQDKKEAMGNYYPLFDPRNPYYEADMPKRNTQMQKVWESHNGRPYTPVPDWSPALMKAA